MYIIYFSMVLLYNNSNIDLKIKKLKYVLLYKQKLEN